MPRWPSEARVRVILKSQVPVSRTHPTELGGVSGENEAYDQGPRSGSSTLFLSCGGSDRARWEVVAVHDSINLLRTCASLVVHADVYLLILPARARTHHHSLAVQIPHASGELLWC